MVKVVTSFLVIVVSLDNRKPDIEFSNNLKNDNLIIFGILYNVDMMNFKINIYNKV